MLGADPNQVISTAGMIGVFLVIFAECALLVGFFLPGDSLLFTAGFLASKPVSAPESLHLSLAPLVVGCAVAAVLGDQVGFALGRRLRSSARRQRRPWVERRLTQSATFFERHGTRTVILARFVGVVRTFVPVAAGLSDMPYRTFLRLNILGGVVWGMGLPLLGYCLGSVPLVESNFEIVILVIVALSVLPLIVEVGRTIRGRVQPTTAVKAP